MLNWFLDIFASKDWAPYGDPKTGEWLMRRRVPGQWVYRPCTAEEDADAAWLSAIK